MPTDIVEGVYGSVVTANDNDRVRVHLQREIIPGLGDLARVAGKQPTSPPDPFEIQLVDVVIAIKRAGQRPTVSARREQIHVEAALVAAVIAYIGRFGDTAEDRWDYIALSASLPVLWVAAMSVARAYEPRFLTVGYEETLTRDAGVWKISARVKREQACPGT